MKYLQMPGFTVRTASDRWTLGYEGENNSRTLQIKTTDDLTDFATVNLLIDTLDCGAMTVTTVGNFKVLSMILTAAMLGEAGKKTCQLLMMDSEGTVIKKTNQFYMVVGHSNVIEGTVPDSERIVIITDYIEEKVDELLGEVGDAVDLHTEEIEGIRSDVSNVRADLGDLDDDVSDLKNQINNQLDLSMFYWELGSLSPGTGNETSVSNRIRSSYIPVASGTKIAVTGNQNCLIVYLFNEQLEYLSDSTWNDGNAFVVGNDSAFYARVLLRKSSANDEMTTDDIQTQLARCNIYTQLPADEYLIQRKVTNIQKNGGDYFRRTVSASASTGLYWNINIDYTPIKAGSTVRFTLDSYSGANLHTVYFKGRKRNGTSITNVTLGSTQIIGKELVFQTIEDYIGYQVQIYRSAQEASTVNAVYGFAVYDSDGYQSYLMSRIEGSGDGTVYDSEIKSSVEAVQTVLAANAKPMLTFAVFTDLHHDSKYVNDPTADLFANIRALNDRLHFDGVLNLGDAIDGQNQTQYVAEGFISDVVNAMYGISAERSHSIPGNHDDNIQSTWSSHGGLDASNHLTNLELYESLSKGSYNEIHSTTRFTDYYIDYDIYDIRAIFISPKYTAWQSETATWLTNTALNTTKKVIVFAHTATKAEWGYQNDISNGVIIETALNNFVSGGGTVIAFIHGHTHGDMIETDSSISFTEVAIGCAKFEKLSSGTSGITYQPRNVNDYTKILFDLVCVDQTNRKVHFIRCGAGSDREISY